LGILPLVVGLLVGTFVVKEIASFFKDYLSEVLSQKTVHRLRTDLYQTVELLPVTYLDSSRTGEMISRVVSDTNEVEKVLSDDMANLISNAVTVSGAIVLLFVVDFNLALFVAPFAAVMVIVVNLFKKRIKQASRRIREAVAELTAKAFEVVSGLRIVKSFVMEHHEADALVPQTTEGRIEFDHVTFGYRPNHNVLEDFSLVIEPGETVAVVGSSGTGKSTVVNLLLRFYQPASGRILIDDYPVDRLNLKSLRGMIGLVLQEPVLFSGTIRENILYGDPEASDED